MSTRGVRPVFPAHQSIWLEFSPPEDLSGKRFIGSSEFKPQFFRTADGLNLLVRKKGLRLHGSTASLRQGEPDAVIGHLYF